MLPKSQPDREDHHWEPREEGPEGKTSSDTRGRGCINPEGPVTLPAMKSGPHQSASPPIANVPAPRRAVCTAKSKQEGKSPVRKLLLVQTGPFTAVGRGPREGRHLGTIVSGRKNCSHCKHGYMVWVTQLPKILLRTFTHYSCYCYYRRHSLLHILPRSWQEPCLDKKQRISPSSSEGWAGWGEGTPSEPFSTISQEWGFLQACAQQNNSSQPVTSAKERQAS